MQNADTVLGVLRERGRQSLPLERLYRQLFKEQLFLVAYGRIYAHDGSPDGLLVDVGGGGVDEAVTGGESVGDGLLGLFGRDLVDAEAEDRHPDTVVQGDLGDLRGHRRACPSVSWACSARLSPAAQLVRNVNACSVFEPGSAV